MVVRRGAEGVCQHQAEYHKHDDTEQLHVLDEEVSGQRQDRAHDEAPAQWRYERAERGLGGIQPGPGQCFGTVEAEAENPRA